MSLRIESRDGAVRVTPESAGWSYVGFEVVRVAGRLDRREATRETCVVVLAGTCDVSAGDVSARGLGRSDVFAGPPQAVYVPPGTPLAVEGNAEVALCTAPAEGRLAPRLLESPTLLTRGEGAEERRIANILMEDQEAEALLVTEVVTPRGHWSSSRRTSTTPTTRRRRRTSRRPTTTAFVHHRLRVPARLFGRRRAGRGDRRPRRRRRARAARLPPGRRRRTSRPLLPERDGGACPRVAHQRRPGLRVTLTASAVTTS